MYATIEDLENRLDPQTLVELADDNADGVADVPVLQAILADAASEVDLFLAARYATPVAAPPPVLSRMAADIAVHALFARKRSAVSPEHAARYANAIKALSEIAAGRLAVPGIATLRQCRSTRTEDERLFSSETLEDF